MRAWLLSAGLGLLLVVPAEQVTQALDICSELLTVGDIQPIQGERVVFEAGCSQ